MKIIEGIKHKGHPYYIPDCSRDDLPEFFKELGFKVGAEIGVSDGKNLEKYCKAGLTMYGIDPWSNDDDDIYNNPFNKTKPYKNMGDVYNLAVEKLSSYPNCTLIRKTSLNALKDIPKRSLDFVYIDGNHMYGYVAMDLMSWAHKVKKSGIIAGHDYYRIGGSRTTRQIKPAVEGYIKAFDIDHWYVLGKKEPRSGEINDKELSFMFFKHW